jgi:outer membrane protein OmpA-like peptidoglycan-associated protein
MPSNSTTEEGRAENRRTEIVSTVPAILAPIQSTYTNVKMDSTSLTVAPQVASPHGIEGWRITCSNASGILADLSGTGAPAAETKIALDAMEPRKLASGGDLTVKMELTDKKGQKIELYPATVRVSFAQSSRRMAQRAGQQRIQERYALVLFDFDKDTVGPSNLDIVKGIAARIKALPLATVEIVGHTDNTGKEDYNQKLSERRAEAVNNGIVAALGESGGGRIKHSGVGPNTPLYDNLTPEARGFNRTVTIQLEYLSAE